MPKLTDWGPNAKFGYPKHGGTLGLWKAVLPFLGDRVRYKKRAACVDEDKHEVVFTDGTTRSYDRLLTTLPLEAFVARLAHAPDSREEGGEEPALQPPVLRRDRPVAAVPVGQELDLLSEPRDARSTG